MCPSDEDDPIPDLPLPAVAGRRLTRSLVEYERAVLVMLAEEQASLAPSSALVALLCDSVRLVREYVDVCCLTGTFQPSEFEGLSDGGPIGHLTPEEGGR